MFKGVEMNMEEWMNKLNLTAVCRVDMSASVSFISLVE